MSVRTSNSNAIYDTKLNECSRTLQHSNNVALLLEDTAGEASFLR